MSILAERLTSQLLAGSPARDPVNVVGHLLAIQAQDSRGARLAVRARSTGLSATSVDGALTDARSLVVTWLNRGTLHLVRSEDYAWLQALTTPPLRTSNARRLSQEGVSPSDADRGVAVIERSLAEEGPLNRRQLRDRITSAGVRTAGQAFVHLLMLASIRGLIVRGPIVAGEHAFVLVRDWLGPSAPTNRERALAELARRYLAGHGPASDRDLARWAGLPLRDARSGLTAIRPELNEGEEGLVDLRNRQPAAPLPAPRLLGSFEPVLLGWSSRQLVLGDKDPLVVRGGLFRQFALVGGRGGGTWTISCEDVEVKPFVPLARREQASLDADARDVARFLST